MRAGGICRDTLCTSAGPRLALKMSGSTPTYRRSVVEMKVAFLQRLAVVALWVGQAKQAFLEEVTAFCQRQPISWSELTSLLLVPKGKANVLQSMRVGNASNAVLAPSEGS